jgi:hypothetical protein
MSSNDIIHLEAHFANWTKERGLGLPEKPFLYYCVEQFVKPFDLGDEEIESGITDGNLDGGVDALYFLLDRTLVREDSRLESKSARHVDLLVFQVKESAGGYSPTEIDKMTFFVSDYLDLSKVVAAMKNKYNPTVLALMETFRLQYRAIAGALPSMAISYYYITKGDESEPNPSALESAERLKMAAQHHFSKATQTVHFVNAQRLLEAIQVKPRDTRELVWVETPVTTPDGYTGLVRLVDFVAFMKDEQGDLDRRIFESNVRGFQNDTGVNQQIKDSLTSSPYNFWLLNNGITILTPEVQPASSKRLTIKWPQIVNGLQTSRSIWDYFDESKPPDEQRLILVRVILSPHDKPELADAVIKATNSQNRMLPASLRATDPIHRKIEQLFKQYGLFYDRRRGSHKDEGRPAAQIVSAEELLQSVLAVMLCRPDEARGRPGDYIREDDKYESIFARDKLPLDAYLKAVEVMRRVRARVAGHVPDRGTRRNIEFYIATHAVWEAAGTVTPTSSVILGVTGGIDHNKIDVAVKRVRMSYDRLGGDSNVAKGTALLKTLTASMRSKLKSRKL